MKKTEFEKEISRMFQDSRMAVDEEKKRQTFCLLAGVIAEQKLVPRMSFPERIRTQLYFVEWRILLAQLLCMLLSAAVYVRADLPWIQAAPYLPAGIASVFSGMLLVLACNREEASGIAELAASCYFNHRQLAALHMVLCGGVQLACLAVPAVLLGKRMQVGAAAMGLYLTVPYLLTGCVEFAVLLTGFGRKSNFTLLAAGCVMAVITGSAATQPELYEPAALGTWIAVFAAVLAVYAAELAAVLERAKFVRMQAAAWEQN